MSNAAKKFEKLIHELGLLIREEADKGLADLVTRGEVVTQENATQWASAFVDARWFDDAEGWKAKFRLVLPNGDLVRLLAVTRAMTHMLREIWIVRKEDQSAAWWGLKVIVNPDGAIKTELDNDPNCVVDPTWYRT